MDITTLLLLAASALVGAAGIWLDHHGDGRLCPGPGKGRTRWLSY